MKIYSRRLPPLMATGVIKPTYDRVLLRAVMQGSSSTLHVTEDVRKAVCHEIVEIGPDVPDSEGFAIGNHCVHISTAGDSPDEDDKSEWCVVRAEDIILVWDPLLLELAVKKSPILTALLGLE